MVVFGGERYERVEIIVHGYERQHTGDYHDDNWLTVQISVAAGAFNGSFDAAFQVAELVAFHGELVGLSRTLQGRAQLQTMEEQLTMDFEGNGLGQVELRGVAVDKPGIGNRLVFALSLDQTQLRAGCDQLARILSAFPVRDA